MGQIFALSLCTLYPSQPKICNIIDDSLPVSTAKECHDFIRDHFKIKMQDGVSLECASIPTWQLVR